MKILKKLVAKSILDTNVKSMVAKWPQEKKEEFLFNIYGVADGTKSGETNYGPWTALTGNFEAVILESGEVYRSSVAILPEPANGMTVNAVKKSEGGVQFAFQIGVRRRDDLQVGYEYVTAPLEEPGEADALYALREKVKQALPPPPTVKVTAITAEVKPEPAPEAAKAKTKK